MMRWETLCASRSKNTGGRPDPSSNEFNSTKAGRGGRLRVLLVGFKLEAHRDGTEDKLRGFAYTARECQLRGIQ